MITTIALPFPYTLYDQTFNSINVSSNGNAQFTTTMTAGLTTLSAVADSRLHYLAVLGRPAHRCKHWLRGYPGGTCGIFTSVSGTAPNRIFNIEWRTVYFAEPRRRANHRVAVV